MVLYGDPAVSSDTTRQDLGPPVALCQTICSSASLLKLTVVSSLKAMVHTCGNVTALSQCSLLLPETEQPAHSFNVSVKFCDIHTGQRAAANVYQLFPLVPFRTRPT